MTKAELRTLEQGPQPSQVNVGALKGMESPNQRLQPINRQRWDPEERREEDEYGQTFVQLPRSFSAVEEEARQLEFTISSRLDFTIPSERTL